MVPIANQNDTMLNMKQNTVQHGVRRHNPQSKKNQYDAQHGVEHSIMHKQYRTRCGAKL